MLLSWFASLVFLAAVGASLVLAALPTLRSPRTGEAAAVAAGSVRWGYHVNFDSASGLASLRAHIRKLTHLAPRWYLLDAAGALSPAPDPNRAAIISLARSAGVRLLPYVRNTAKWDGLTPFLSSPQARAAAVANITNAVMAEGFDGIHIDFEEINATDRDRLTQFITELAAALHARGKLMTQAMGPKTADAATGWAAAWDYAALGKVNDLVVIMAYTAPGNTPHPIAPAAWVEANITYALGKLPADRVVLGIPFYGYDWNTSAGTAGEVLTGPQAQALAAAHGVTPSWSETEQESTFTYRRDGQQHRVWYAERRSVEVRLGLVQRYGLAGAAFWRLGQETPDVWASLAATTPPAAPTPAATATIPLTSTPTAVSTATATSRPRVTATAGPTATATASSGPTATATATALARTFTPSAAPTENSPTPEPTGVMVKEEALPLPAAGGVAPLALGIVVAASAIGIGLRWRRR